MKLPTPRLARLLGLGALLLLTHRPVLAQTPPGPGPEHEHLKRLAGEWTATVKSPEGNTPGTLSAKIVCGGLWLATEFHSEFGGMKFSGHGLDGYDPASKKYVSVWVDSTTTKPLMFEGTLDAAKKTLTLTGAGVGMDGKPAKFKSVTHYPDADHQLFEMYLVATDGKEEKMMTIEYVRKK